MQQVLHLTEHQNTFNFYAEKICDLLFATNQLSCPSHLSNKSVVFGDYRAELSTPITLRVQAVAMPLI